MITTSAPPLHLRAAHVWTAAGVQVRDLYVQGGRVVATRPRHAQTLALAGLVLAGGVNAHEHLELNHYPRTRFAPRYDNAHQWGEAVNAQLDSEPYKTLRQHPYWDKILVGAMKNLLAGVTTVIQHGRADPTLFRRALPVRVLRPYAWAHTLHFTPHADIQKAYRASKGRVPFFIHLAEGTDDTARAEYAALKRLGCVGANTVLIHAVGMSAVDRADALAHGCRVVWCPSSNAFLLGATLAPQDWGAALTLGSDSRLTADGDFLDEVAHARAYDPRTLPQWTAHNARAFGLHDVGHLEVGARADFVLWAGTPDSTPRRHELALVVKDGVPLLGDPALMDALDVPSHACTLDGAPKRLHEGLASLLARNALPVAGLSLD